MSVRRIINKQLGEVLIEQGIINQVQLEKALAVQKEKGSGLLGEVLVTLGFAKEEDIAQALTVQFGFPYLPLGNYEINADIVNLIPSRVARQYLLIPIDKIGNNMTVAMSNPLNVQAVEDIELITGCNVQVFVCTLSDIRRAIEKYYKEEREKKEAK